MTFVIISMIFHSCHSDFLTSNTMWLIWFTISLRLIQYWLLGILSNRFGQTFSIQVIYILPAFNPPPPVYPMVAWNSPLHRLCVAHTYSPLIMPWAPVCVRLSSLFWQINVFFHITYTSMKSFTAGEREGERKRKMKQASTSVK